MAIFMPKGAPKGGTKFAWALPEFDQEKYDKSEAGMNAAKMQEIYRKYPDDEMHCEVLKYWEEHGVKKELYDAEIDGGLGKYSVFTPLDMNPSKKYALVYVSHGGLQPINQCETNGFPMLAGKEKFICVCPWNRGPSNDEVESEFPRIIKAVIENGYPVDRERIYAVGYSAGSDATGVLACAYPEMIAAVSPDPGGNLFAKGMWYADASYYKKNIGYKMPMICLGGTMDGGDRYPLVKEEHIQNFNIWLKYIVKAADYEELTLEKSKLLAADQTDKAKQAFGFNFQNSYTLQMENIEWFCGEYYNEDHVAVARFITGEGLPHAQTKYHAPVIWDFIKHFRRDINTGESIYVPVVIDGIRP